MFEICFMGFIEEYLAKILRIGERVFLVWNYRGYRRSEWKRGKIN